MDTVFAILVVYNPSAEDLLSAVENLEAQCQKVVVCNNSDNGFFYENVDERLKIFNFNDNLGIAKAQSIGMDWAFKHGADFIIQMDQDSLISPGTVEGLLRKYMELEKNGYKVGVIGPAFFDKVTKQIAKPRVFKGRSIDKFNCISVSVTISSGSLVPKKVYDDVGGMCDGLFIDVVDWEYCWRIIDKGYLVIRDNDILMGHRVGQGFKKIYHIFPVLVSAPIRHYYHTRNLILLLSCPYAPLPWKIIGIGKLIFKIIMYPLGFSNGFTRVRYIIKGLIDGILGRYGRIDKTYRVLK